MRAKSPSSLARARKVQLLSLLCAAASLSLPQVSTITPGLAEMVPSDRPQLVLQAGHSADVISIAISPDGRWLISGSGDKTIKVWELATGREVRTLAGHVDERGVWSIAISSNGQWLVSGGADKTIKVWELATGREVRTLTGHADDVRSVAVSPDGRWLVSGSGDKTIKVWELATGREVRTLAGHSGFVNSVAVSPDGRWLVSGSSDKTIKVWELATGREVRTLTGHTDRVWSVAFSPDGRWLASGSGDTTIKIWEMATGREIRTLTGHASDVWALAISPDGRWLVSGTADNGLLVRDRGIIKVWELATGREVHTLTGHSNFVESVAISPDGRWLASGSLDNTIKVWELATGREVRTLTGHAHWVWCVAISPDGRWLASGSWDNTIKVWELATGHEVRTLTGHSGSVMSVAFSPDARLASSSSDGSTRIWNAETGAEAAALIATREGTDWVVITPAGLFDGSPQGMQTLVAWRIGNQTYPPDRFFNDFYAPGLLARILAGEQLKPQITLAELKLPPDVHIIAPTTGTLKQGHVSVSVAAEDRGGGIAEVRLYHNEKLVGVRPGIPGAKSTYTFDVTLIPGENVLKVLASNTEKVESNGDVVRIVLEAPAPARPALYVLVVGINAYEDAAFNLGFARPDAEAIAQFFERRGRQLFRSVNVIRVFDHEATRGGIQQALNQVADRAQREDVVLIYLAGHGVGLEQQFYFLPQEMRQEADEEAAVHKYGIPATALGDALSRTQALKQVVILDACNAGNALPVLAKALKVRGLGAAGTKAVQMLARSTGVYLIAASTKQQYAIEIPALGHGVLAYALLNGLEKEAPAGPDGIVTVYSVLQYINQAVPELSARYHGGDKQYPVSYNTGMDFPLWVR